MSSSDVSVINEALVRIGASPISSLNDANAQAISAAEIFPTVYRDTMGLHPWHFALRSRQLAKVEVPQEDREWHEGKYVYQLPSGMLRALGLEDGGRYQIAGPRLFTDQKSVRLLYVADTPIEQWPDYFRLLVVLRFAAAIAVAVTDSSRRSQGMLQEAQLQQRAAMSIDSQQVPQKVFDLMKIYTRTRYNPLAGA